VLRNFADRRYLNIGQATAGKCFARWNSSSVSSLGAAADRFAAETGDERFLCGGATVPPGREIPIHRRGGARKRHFIPLSIAAIAATYCQAKAWGWYRYFWKPAKTRPISSACPKSAKASAVISVLPVIRPDSLRVRKIDIYKASARVADLAARSARNQTQPPQMLASGPRSRSTHRTFPATE